jgi:hypothetical protein
MGKRIRLTMAAAYMTLALTGCGQNPTATADETPPVTAEIVECRIPEHPHYDLENPLPTLVPEPTFTPQEAELEGEWSEIKVEVWDPLVSLDETVRADCESGDWSNMPSYLQQAESLAIRFDAFTRWRMTSDYYTRRPNVDSYIEWLQAAAQYSSSTQ